MITQSDLDAIDKIESESFPAFKIKDYNTVINKLKKYGLLKLDRIVDSLHSGKLNTFDKTVIRKYVIKLMKQIHKHPNADANMKAMLKADHVSKMTDEAYEYFREKGYNPNNDKFTHLPLPETIKRTQLYRNFLF